MKFLNIVNSLRLYAIINIRLAKAWQSLLDIVTLAKCQFPQLFMWAHRIIVNLKVVVNARDHQLF